MSPEDIRFMAIVSMAVLGVLSILWMFWGGPYAKEIPRDRPGRYMTRYSLRYMHPDGGGPWRAYLQQFHGPDDEGHHNHPSRWSFSIVLWGSYTEERLEEQGGLDFDGNPVEFLGTVRRRVRWFNFLRGSDYHRIVALHPRRNGGSVWTLFFVGPLTGDGWGFWIPGRGHVDFQTRKAEREQAVRAKAGA